MDSKHLIEFCQEMKVQEVINYIERGYDYTKYEDGILPFHYLSVPQIERPTIPEADETAYNELFLTREDDKINGHFNYKNGEMSVHSQIIKKYCESMTLDVSEQAAIVFAEWCYCSSSYTLLTKLPPFMSINCSLELLKCEGAKAIWQYIETYCLYLCCEYPDITFSLLKEFDKNEEFQAKHRPFFQKVCQSFLSTFPINGGDTFFPKLSKELVVECLKCIAN